MSPLGAAEVADEAAGDAAHAGPQLAAAQVKASATIARDVM